MRLERLCDSNKHLFDRAFALYESSFPREERRDETEQNRVLLKDDYHVDFIMDGDEFLGVMLYWETESFIYLEHFTTRAEIRNRGIGAAALDLLKSKGKTILLEIDPPEDEIAIRRLEFYKRNGFLMTPHYHIQAKYHLGDEDLMLKILSYPHIISPELYREFQEYMTREIGILPSHASEVTVRPVQDGDDLMQIAKLIYLSDKYIYPYWFDSIEDAQKVICAMMDLDTLYNKRNITVAVAPDGVIAGASVSKLCPIIESEEEIVKAFHIAGVTCDERTHDIFCQYYDKMREDSDGLYLANIAVDPEYRNRGIAATLVSYLLNATEKSHLECVQANVGAWRLYQRLGFSIVLEYPGVFDVPCYKMIYNSKG